MPGERNFIAEALKNPHISIQMEKDCLDGIREDPSLSGYTIERGFKFEFPFHYLVVSKNPAGEDKLLIIKYSTRKGYEVINELPKPEGFTFDQAKGWVHGDGSLHLICANGAGNLEFSKIEAASTI